MNVGFIGAGHIAGAMARGWHASRAAEGPSLLLYDVVPARAADLAETCAGAAFDSVADLVAASDLVFLAVRPQDVDAALAAIGPRLEGRGVVSLAAGVTLERLRAALPDDARVARLMPNIAAELGLGVFLLVPGTLGALAAPLQRAVGTIGTTVELDESLFDVATAVSGCMPGFMAFITEAFAAAAQQGGLDAQTARRLAVAAAHGAAATVAASGDPAAVMAATATPGGMTSAGLAELRASSLASAIEGAVAAAAARAKELA
jgi:pyrroline-5-carboxylate reductase